MGNNSRTRKTTTQTETINELYPLGTFASPEIASLMDPNSALRSGKFVGGPGGALQEMIDYMTGAAPNYAQRNMARVGRAGERLQEISGFQEAMGSTGALTAGQVSNAASNAMGAANTAGIAAQQADNARRRAMIPQFLSMIQQSQGIRSSTPWQVRQRGNIDFADSGASTGENAVALIGGLFQAYMGGGGGGGGGFGGG